MKNVFTLGIIALIAVIGFVVIACDNGNGDQNCKTCGKYPCQCQTDITCEICEEEPCECQTACTHVFGDNWLPTTTASWCVDGVCGNGIETLTCTLCPETNGTRISDPCKGTQALVITDGIVKNDPANKTLAVVCIPDKRDGAPVTEIEDFAFSDCCCAENGDWAENETLTSVRIGANVVTIGDMAFMECISLETVTFAPNSQLLTIGDRAFRNCTSLETVTFAPNSQLLTISDGAFTSCESLTSIEIPASVTSIGDWAFYRTAITSITIPASVTTIGESMFDNCTSLETVIFAPNSQLQTISRRAFHACTSLTSIEIPASVTSIGIEAFFVCCCDGKSSLTTVTFVPNSQLQTIGDKAFSRTAITSITIPASVITIGANAFHFCDFTSITIPANVTFIGGSAFQANASLETVTVLAIIPPVLERWGVFYNCDSLREYGAENILDSLTAIFVPADSVNAYKQAERWSEYADLIVAIE